MSDITPEQKRQLVEAYEKAQAKKRKREQGRYDPRTGDFRDERCRDVDFSWDWMKP